MKYNWYCFYISYISLSVRLYAKSCDLGIIIARFYYKNKIINIKNSYLQIVYFNKK